MTKTTIKERVFDLEAELKFIKKTLEREPDFDIDEKNWRRTKPTLKKIRKELYQNQSRYDKK